jgi:nucleoside-diphosphate-sugar epimerase
VKIALTGASGFVGGWLTRALLNEEHDILFLHRRSERFTSRRENFPNAQFLATDESVESLAAGLKEFRPDAVIHLASLFISEHKPSDVLPLIQSNLTFPIQLLEAMSLAGCHRLINTGSSWQHFGGESYNPVNLYASTKQAFEDVIRYYVEARSLQVIHLHLTDTYGPEDSRGKLISALLRISSTGERLSMSPGEQEIDLVHIHDVVTAYMTALTRIADVRGQETFAVRSDNPLTLKSVVALLERLSGKQLNIGWGERPYRQREVMKAWRSGETIPGWRPKMSLEQGLRELLP